MEGYIALSVAVLALTVVTVNGQISTPCTVSMIAGFTPCVNYLTGSSANGRSPTASCCASLESLMTTSMDCTCLIVTGNVPFSLPSPINQALAITLPQACNSDSVPLQCKASGIPLPPPGPALFAPPPPKALPPRALPPTADSPESPLGPSASETAGMAPAPSEMMTPDISPEAADEPEAPEASPSGASLDPTVTSGIRPVLTPASASNSLPISSPLLLLVLAAAIAVPKFY